MKKKTVSFIILFGLISVASCNQNSISSFSYGSFTSDVSVLSSIESALQSSSSNSESEYSLPPKDETSNDSISENPANGIYDLANLSNEEKINAIGALEKYVIKHHMVSPNVFSDGIRLNYNTCDEEMWEYLFGENGTILKTEKDNYWPIKPIMHNGDFLSGLDCCIDHISLANEFGKQYEENNIQYISEQLTFAGENIQYNASQVHKDNIKSLLEGTDGTGFSIPKARAYFKRASMDLINAGLYRKGDKINLEIADGSYYGHHYLSKIIKNVETAFNSCGGGLTISFNEYVSKEWFGFFNDKYFTGQYDIGLGSISGGAYRNCVQFLTLRSDTSYGFTTSWGTRTDIVDKSLVYNNQCWSFNALLSAIQQKSYIDNGQETNLELDKVEITYNKQENGDYIINITAEPKYYIDQYKSEFYGAEFFALSKEDKSKSYSSGVLEGEQKNGGYEFVFDNEQFSEAVNIFGSNKFSLGVCVYRKENLFGEEIIKLENKALYFYNGEQ